MRRAAASYLIALVKSPFSFETRGWERRHSRFCLSEVVKVHAACESYESESDVSVFPDASEDEGFTTHGVVSKWQHHPIYPKGIRMAELATMWYVNGWAQRTCAQQCSSASAHIKKCNTIVYVSEFEFVLMFSEKQKQNNKNINTPIKKQQTTTR